MLISVESNVMYMETRSSVYKVRRTFDASIVMSHSHASSEIEAGAEYEDDVRTFSLALDECDEELAMWSILLCVDML